MGYSPWGRKESDTTERLHLLNVALFCHVLGKIEKAKRKPICRRQDYLGRERDEGWLLAAKFAPHDLAFDHS